MKNLWCAALFLIPVTAVANEWCSVSNFGVYENTGSVTLAGTLSGSSGTVYRNWLRLDRSTDPEVAKKRLAMALTARVGGLTFYVYVPAPYSCTTVPEWTIDTVLHVRVGD